MSLLGPKELTCHLPQDCVQAKFSLEFAIASRLIKGPIKLSSFNDADVKDPEIQAFMKKIEMKVSPELAKLGFIGTAPIRLKIRLKSGEEIFLSNDLALGNPEKPLSTAMVYQKFLDCSARAVSKDRAEAWFQILQKLPQAASHEILSLGAIV